MKLQTTEEVVAMSVRLEEAEELSEDVDISEAPDSDSVLCGTRGRKGGEVIQFALSLYVPLSGNVVVEL